MGRSWLQSRSLGGYSPYGKTWLEHYLAQCNQFKGNERDILVSRIGQVISLNGIFYDARRGSPKYQKPDVSDILERLHSTAPDMLDLFANHGWVYYSVDKDNKVKEVVKISTRFRRKSRPRTRGSVFSDKIRYDHVYPKPSGEDKLSQLEFHKRYKPFLGAKVKGKMFSKSRGKVIWVEGRVESDNYGLVLKWDHEKGWCVRVGYGQYPEDRRRNVPLTGKDGVLNLRIFHD